MDFLFLSQTALFRGCSPRETADMLQCLRAERRVYERDRVICHAGDTVEALGLVLSGGVNIESVRRLGQPEHSGPGRPRAGFCRNLCLSAGRTADGGRRGGRSRTRRCCFSIRRACCSTCPSACAHHAGAHPQPAGRDIAEEPRALPPDFPHLAQNHPRAAAVLPFRPGACGKTAAASPFPSTASSWRITLAWTAARFPPSWAGCARRASYRFRKNEFELLREP